MGYGGVINKITDPFGIGNTAAPKTPSPGRVGRDYLGLISAFSQGAPTVYGTEAEWKPQYNALDLSQLQSTIPTFANITQNLSPQASAIVRGANPGQTGLLDQLTQNAGEQLDAGANLDPALARVFQQNVRGGQAARGLGFGPGDVFNESLGLTEMGNQLRTEREQFAGNVAGMNNQFETQPTLEMLQSIPMTSEAINRGSGPTIIPSNQSYDAFNTAYNARAAANIAGANNAAAANNSY